jgi:hypothetical protein
MHDKLLYFDRAIEIKTFHMICLAGRMGNINLTSSFVF